mgnify:CR=1 FL=1
MDIQSNLVQQFTVSYDRVKRCVADVSDEDARRVLAGTLSPIVWQFGHVTLIDSNFVRRAGGTFEVPARFVDLFKIGSGGEADYPPLGDVAAAFDGVQQELLRAVREANYDTAIDTPNYKNVGQMLIYAGTHRAYHTGKMTTLRALLGKPRLFG